MTEPGYLRVKNVSSGADRPIVRSANQILGIAATNQYLFWSVAGDGAPDNTWIMRSTLDGHQQTKVVNAGNAVASPLVVADGYVYWIGSDGNTIGRMDENGGELDRALVSVDGKEDIGSLASDGRYLYFARYSGDNIARVRLDGSSLDERFIRLRDQDIGITSLVVAGPNLYYGAEVEYGRPSYIGRTPRDGSGAGARFTLIRSGWLPDAVTAPADSDDIYWTAYTEGPARNSLSRTNVNGKPVTRLVSRGNFSGDMAAVDLP